MTSTKPDKKFYILPHSAGAFKHLNDLCEGTEIQPIAWKLKQKMKKVSVLRETLIFAVAVVASYSVADATKGRGFSYVLVLTFFSLDFNNLCIPIKQMIFALLMVLNFRTSFSPTVFFSKYNHILFILEIEANQGISRGGPSRPIGYANFEAHKFSYLNITILGESLVERGSVCALACLETAPCFSFNLAAFPDINAGKLWCGLLPSDKYNNSEKFVHSNYFHHFSIAVS